MQAASLYMLMMPCAILLQLQRLLLQHHCSVHATAADHALQQQLHTSVNTLVAYSAAANK
jgi:hypothetical protein